MSTGRDIAVIGAAMHPWGTWGRNFVEYGVVAAQQALQDVEAEEHLILDKKFRPREGVNQHYARALIE